MKYLSKQVSVIIIGICLISSACKEGDMQTEAIKSEEIDNHASIPAKEIETPTYGFNTSSINVESWSEFLKSEVIKEKSILEPWSCDK